MEALVKIYVTSMTCIALCLFVLVLDMKKEFKGKKCKAIRDCYIGEEKRPSIRKGQKWIINGLVFSEQAEQIGFCSTWTCKRLGTEIYLHKKEMIETFGIDSLDSIRMKVNIK